MATIQRYSHHQQAQAKASERHAEDTRAEHLRNLAAIRLEDAQQAANKRVANKRRVREAQQLQNELDMEEAFLHKLSLDDLRKDQLEREQSLALEMQRLKHDEESDRKLRQQICENSIEIRELQAKLRAGYMNKEIAAQIAEKERLRCDIIAREEEIALTIADQTKRAQETAKALEEEKRLMNLRFKEQLRQQLDDRQMRKLASYEELLKEKLMIDEIVRKIWEEDQREKEREMEKRNATKLQMEEFKLERAEWKRMERERMEEENRKILNFSIMQQSREEGRMEETRKREESKNKIFENLTKKMVLERQEKDEMEEVLLELRLEEQKAADIELEKAEIEKRIRTKLEIQRSRKDQMAFKQKRDNALREEEDRFRQMMLDKFAEDDRLEQMSAQRRRLKQQEHKRAVEAMINEKRNALAFEKEQQIEEKKLEEEMDNMRRQIIEEERRRLLLEHAEKLIGYLPKGVIRDEADLQLFDEEFRRKFTERKPGPFDDSDYDCQ